MMMLLIFMKLTESMTQIVSPKLNWDNNYCLYVEKLRGFFLKIGRESFTTLAESSEFAPLLFDQGLQIFIHPKNKKN